MEENTVTIKKKYVFAVLLVLAMVFGYSLNAIFAGTNKPLQQSAGMPSSNSMESHHKTYVQKPSGFFQSAIGKQAPDFELQDLNGNTVKLSDYRRKYVVLFFNEGSMCYPSCWNQIAEFAKDERFNKDDVIVFSIVVDSQSQWQQIIRKVPQMANARILFDTGRKVSADYDVLFVESSMHKVSYPGHTYFAIDKNGIVRFILDDARMAINNDKIALNLETLEGA